MRLSRPIAAAFALFSMAAALGGQSVHVALVDSAADVPMVGALVSIVDSGGAAVATALSDRAGGAVVRAPVPGDYTILVRRVGFAPFTSERSITLGQGETAPIVLRVASARVSLSSARVGKLDRSCPITGRAQLAALPAWGEVRTALESTQLARALVASQWRIRRYERWLTAGGDIYHDTAYVGRGERFFGMPNAERLSRDGYVHTDHDGSATYLVPDPRVVLSDQFAADHCFAVQSSDSLAGGLLAIVFAPRRDRDQPEVEGTFWLDPTTAELRAIDFHYVHVPNQPNHQAIGRVRFQHPAAGLWMMQSWKLRVPRMSAEDEPGYPLVFNGWYEVGGEAVP